MRGPWWVVRGTVRSSHPRWVVRLGLGFQENTHGPTARPESFRGSGPGGDRGWPTGARRLRARPRRLGLSHLSGGCQVPVIPLLLKLPVGGKQHVFGEGRVVNEWTKGCGPWGLGPVLGRGAFLPLISPPSSPRGWETPTSSSGRSQPRAGRAPGASAEVHWIFQPSEALPNPHSRSVTSPTLHRPWEMGEVCISQPL